MAEQPQPQPQPPKDPRQTFVALFRILDGDKSYAPGEKAKLTREQFDELKALGAIEGDWK